MAYSNWGAIVQKRAVGKLSVRQRDREDVPVFGDPDVEAAGSGARIWINLIKAREQGKELADHEHCQHAVLGSGKLRLCGYKSYPKLFRAHDDGSVEAIDLAPYRDAGEPMDWNWYENGRVEGELDGYLFRATRLEEPERVELELIEPDGTSWTGVSGYAMGAGFEEDEP